MRIFGSPERYIQGPGVLAEIGTIAEDYGSPVCIVVDAGVRDIVEPAMARSLRDAGIAFEVRSFAGEITYAAIDALTAEARPASPKAVIAVGGGKGLDVGKGVAVRLGVPVITVPTIASNDAPTSASFAVYDDHHVMIAVDRMVRNPSVVLVDTALIANAPASFLRAGIGDALTKKFEADGCWAGTGVTPFRTRPLRIGKAVADEGYRILRAHAAAALKAVERKEVTEDLEATVEACILMSGLGFENGGLSFAHSMTRGLVKARDAKNAPHGEQVGYAVVVQLAVERRSDAEVLDLIGFNREVGLPVNLSGLGMQRPTRAEIDDIARWTMTAPHIPNLGLVITAEDVAAAILRVEALAGSPVTEGAA